MGSEELWQGFSACVAMKYEQAVPFLTPWSGGVYQMLTLVDLLARSMQRMSMLIQLRCTDARVAATYGYFGREP
jgi:hypothetical protein